MKQLYRLSVLVLALAMLASLFASSALAAGRLEHAGLAQPAASPTVEPGRNAHCASLAGREYLACLGVYFTAAAAPKPAGLAQPVPASTLSQAAQVCPGPKGSIAWRACAYGYAAPATDAATKPAGLAQPAPVTAASQPGQACPWGYPAYDKATQAFVSQCSSVKLEAPAKPAGLAQPTPLKGLSQDGQNCPWGYPIYDPVTHEFVSQCASR